MILLMIALDNDSNDSNDSNDNEVNTYLLVVLNIYDQ